MKSALGQKRTSPSYLRNVCFGPESGRFGSSSSMSAKCQKEKSRVLGERATPGVPAAVLLNAGPKRSTRAKNADQDATEGPGGFKIEPAS